MQGSDQWSYWANGVPAAILFSGVSEVHTAADVRDFGGVAGIAADPCQSGKCVPPHAPLPHSLLQLLTGECPSCALCYVRCAGYHKTCDTILNVSPIVLSRLTSMYGAVLQQLATSNDVRALLRLTEPPLMTLAPSVHELRAEERAAADCRARQSRSSGEPRCLRRVRTDAK